MADVDREKAYASEIGEQISAFLKPIAVNDAYLKDHAFQRTLEILAAKNTTIEESLSVLGIPQELKYHSSLPAILFMNLGGVGITRAKIDGHMDVHASTSDSLSSKTDAGAEGSGKIGWGPISASVKVHASTSVSTDRKRQGDYSAGVNWEVEVGQMAAPEGTSKILDILQSFQAMGNDINKTRAQQIADSINPSDAKDDPKDDGQSKPAPNSPTDKK